MEKRKITGCTSHRSCSERLGMALLWLLYSTAAVLMPIGATAYADSSVVGNEESLIVTNWKGEYLGTTSHVLMDPSAGKIIFVIVSFETEKNKIKKIAVPYDLFSVDTENRILVLGTGRKKLDEAPEYKPSDLEDPEFVGRTYRYFAASPPWTKEQPRKGVRLSL